MALSPAWQHYDRVQEENGLDSGALYYTNVPVVQSAEEAMKLTSMRTLSLEECLEFIDDDELLEVTPKNLRMRKRVLDTEARKKLDARRRQQA